MGSVIKPCTCASQYQDRKYGIGMRVWNACGAKNKGKFRCSVCERES